MSGKELPEAEGMDTPTSQTQPHPATIQEGFSYCHSDGFAPLNSSDSPLLSFQQTPSDVGSRTVSIQSLNQDFLPMDNSVLHNSHGRLILLIFLRPLAV
jgi:hypothetical protein